jgi:hypothetical protein
MQPGCSMRHDVMSVQTRSLLHNLMIVAIPSAAVPLAMHARSHGAIEQFATQIGESIRVFHAQTSTAALTNAVAT